MVVTALKLQASLPMCSYVVAKAALRILQCFELLRMDGRSTFPRSHGDTGGQRSICEQKQHSLPVTALEKALYPLLNLCSKEKLSSQNCFLFLLTSCLGILKPLGFSFWGCLQTQTNTVHTWEGCGRLRHLFLHM